MDHYDCTESWSMERGHQRSVRVPHGLRGPRGQWPWVVPQEGRAEPHSLGPSYHLREKQGSWGTPVWRPKGGLWGAGVRHCYSITRVWTEGPRDDMGFGPMGRVTSGRPGRDIGSVLSGPRQEWPIEYLILSDIFTKNFGTDGNGVKEIWKLIHM